MDNRENSHYRDENGHQVYEYERKDDIKADCVDTRNAGFVFIIVLLSLTFFVFIMLLCGVIKLHNDNNIVVGGILIITSFVGFYKVITVRLKLKKANLLNNNEDDVNYEFVKQNSLSV